MKPTIDNWRNAAEFCRTELSRVSSMLCSLGEKQNLWELAESVEDAIAKVDKLAWTEEKLKNSKNLEEEKEGLINLITWYRDQYHHDDWCHSEMVEQIKQVKEIKNLEIFWKTVDNWIDT